MGFTVMRFTIIGDPITTIEVEAKTTMQDDEIFLVETDDAENDEVFYNITSCDPSTLADCPFEILPSKSKISLTTQRCNDIKSSLIQCCFLALLRNDFFQ